MATVVKLHAPEGPVIELAFKFPQSANDMCEFWLKQGAGHHVTVKEKNVPFTHDPSLPKCQPGILIDMKV